MPAKAFQRTIATVISSSACAPLSFPRDEKGERALQGTDLPRLVRLTTALETKETMFRGAVA